MSLCGKMRNLSFILKAMGGFLTSCQKMVCFSHGLKYISDQPAAPRERSHAQTEDPTKKLAEPWVLPVLQAANIIH